MTIEPTEPAKLTRPRALVDAQGHAVIVRALTLRLAMSGETKADDQELYGVALAGVCSDWLAITSERLRKERTA